MTQVRFAEGERIFSQGDPGDRAFVVVSGEVRISRNMGTRYVDLATLRPGSIFGELSLFDGRPRAANAVATVPTVVMEVSRERFDTMLEEMEPFTRNLVEGLVDYCRTWLRLIDEELGDEGLTDEDKAICSAFLRFLEGDEEMQ